LMISEDTRRIWKEFKLANLYEWPFIKEEHTLFTKISFFSKEQINWKYTITI
jgi:hypothetical protein